MKSGARRLRLSDLKTKVSVGLFNKLYLLSALRIGSNLLDLAGIAGVAFLASLLGSGVINGNRFTAQLGFFGELDFSIFDLLLLCFATLSVFVVKSALSIWLKYRTAKVIADVETKMSKILTEEYFSRAQGRSFRNKETLSDFQNRTMSSTEALGLFINARLSVVTEASLLIGLVFAFFLISPLATAAALAYVTVVMLVLGLVVRGKIESSGKRQIQASKDTLSISRDLFGTAREVSAAGSMGEWLNQFTKSRNQAAKSRATTYTLSSMPRYVIETSLMVGIFGFLAVVLLFGDLESQAVTIGVFLAGGLRMVALLVPLQAAIDQMKDGSSRGQNAADKLLSLKVENSSQSSNQDPFHLPNKPFGLSVQDLSFAYENEKPALKKVSIEAKPGSKVAIVGPSGSGKSTLLDLCTGFLNPQSGSVHISGMTPSLIVNEGAGALGIVPQRPNLVTGTLARNVALRNESEIDKEQVRQCLIRAGLANFSSADYLETLVEPDSGQFSGGEIQRIGVARALYGKPGILFLDEATSGLDAEKENEISELLESLRNEITIVMIAHRLKTIKTADKIVYLSHGEVVAQGNFDQLQEKVPDFRRAVELMRF